MKAIRNSAALRSPKQQHVGPSTTEHPLLADTGRAQNSAIDPNEALASSDSSPQNRPSIQRPTSQYVPVYMGSRPRQEETTFAPESHSCLSPTCKSRRYLGTNMCSALALRVNKGERITPKIGMCITPCWLPSVTAILGLSVCGR